jgi:hypothetical protein
MAIIEDGVVVDADAYEAVVNDMQALRPRLETLQKFQITSEDYHAVGALALGGDGLTQLYFDLKKAKETA